MIDGEPASVVVGAGRQDVLMPPETQPLIGRSDELDVLLSALDVVNEPVGAGLLLSGDAGVGKTRLLVELLERANERGVVRMVGHCIDFGDVGLPYLPFTEAFGRLARERPELAEQLHREYPPLVRLLPQHRTIGAPAPRDEAPLERGELFAAVLAALARIGQEQPTVLVIEDAHWADHSTRDLIGFLLTRLDGERVALVVSYRSDDLHRRHPLRGAVAEWSRLPGVRRLHLGPLPDADVRSLIRAVAPTITEDVISSIIRRAEGNAFITEELITAAGDSDCADAMVPPALADLLLVRLDRLSEPARSVVRLAAVAGSRVPHEALEVVAELPPRELDNALREAVEAHILQPSGHARYGFRHALLGEVVYDDLLPGERVRLHATFAAALLKESIKGTAADLARHARESHDLTTAFTASVRAGDEAVAVAAPQEGMQHYEAALQLLPVVGDPQSADAVGLIVATADAAAAAGHLARAARIPYAALTGFSSAMPIERARLLHSYALHSLGIEREVDASAACIEALKLVPDEPTPLLARLATLQARTMSQLGRHDDAVRWARQAIDIAASAGEPTAATDAWTTLAVEERRAGDPTSAARQLEEIAAHAHEAHLVREELRVLFQLGLLWLGVGDLERSRHAYQRCCDRGVAEGHQWAPYAIDATAHLAIVHTMLGEWDAALRVTDTSAGGAPPLAEVKLLAAASVVHTARGDHRILEQLPRLRTRWRDDGVIAIWGLSQAIEVHTQLRDPAAALGALAEMIDVVTDVWQQPWFSARLRSSALAIAALSSSVSGSAEQDRLAAVERGAQLHADGLTTADRSSTAAVPLGPESEAWLRRLDAEWARLRWLADVDPPSADDHEQLWRAALAAFDDQPYEAARCRLRLAEVLRAGGRTSEAAEQLAEARAFAELHGAAPLSAAIDAIERPRASRGGQAPAATGLAALTAREHDVLDLLAEGRTNRQIARQLYISDKTVSVHVSNILAKLAVRSRTEAAAVARRGGER